MNAPLCDTSNSCQADITLCFLFRWFFGNIKRPEAEKLLLSPPNEHGAFLIRDNTKDKPSFALSIRDGDVTKHYRIRTTDDGQYFIARHQLLNSLKELVEHYAQDADGLCDVLKKPAVDVSVKCVVVGFMQKYFGSYSLKQNILKVL